MDIGWSLFTASGRSILYLLSLRRICMSEILSVSFACSLIVLCVRIVTFVCIIALACCPDVRRKFPTNMIFLGIFVSICCRLTERFCGMVVELTVYCFLFKLLIRTKIILFSIYSFVAAVLPPQTNWDCAGQVITAFFSIFHSSHLCKHRAICRCIVILQYNRLFRQYFAKSGLRFVSRNCIHFRKSVLRVIGIRALTPLYICSPIM